MKILVTGGAGFIGSHVCEKLFSQNHEIIVLDDLSTGDLANLSAMKNQILFFQSQVENFDFNSLNHIDCVIHLAAQASVPLSISNFLESSKTNILSSLKVVDFCIKNKIPLVYASSSAIYGSMPLGDDENNATDLISPYAADKLALELYAKVSSKTSGLNSIGLRFFNVYGPRQDPSNPYSGVISIFIDRSLSNSTIIINGGAQTRDFIYVKDIAEVISKSVQLASKTKISETVNVLTGKSVSINSLADKIIKLVNSSSNRLYKELPHGDPLESNGTIAKLSRLFNISTSDFITLNDGLEMTVNDIKPKVNKL